MAVRGMLRILRGGVGDVNLQRAGRGGFSRQRCELNGDSKRGRESVGVVGAPRKAQELIAGIAPRQPERGVAARREMDTGEDAKALADVAQLELQHAGAARRNLPEGERRRQDLHVAGPGTMPSPQEKLGAGVEVVAVVARDRQSAARGSGVGRAEGHPDLSALAGAKDDAGVEGAPPSGELKPAENAGLSVPRSAWPI